MSLLPPTSTTMTPRPYQEEAMQAVYDHLCNHDTNPCVVIPTGGGKSPMMAWMIQRFKRDHDALRVIILAHRKELVAQNSDELATIWPEADIGVYSAGLGRRDMDNSIIYASIDSVYKKGGEFAPFDLIVVDEAHRIPPSGEGKYRTFIDTQRIQNKHLRVVGFTATPYRMTGALCHKDHILHKVCYEAKVFDLISQGYLCRLWSRRGEHQPDISAVEKNRKGDYVQKSLSDAVDTEVIVSQAVHDAVANIRQYGRKSVMFFCVDVKHCEHVSAALRQYGITAPTVTQKTSKRDRDRYAADFKTGRLTAICNVNVYTEGFNAKQVDCIVLLRPTLSKGLYVQMVGRGLRVHPSKQDCLVLDYAHCIDEHGPIDCIDEGEVPLYDCQACGNVFSRQIRICPICGWKIPPQEIERLEAEERERRLHEIRASQHQILSGEPTEYPVDGVKVHRHIKFGSPDSLRVEYRCGLSVVREWVCLDHEGFPGAKAKQWWKARLGDPVPDVDGALSVLFLDQAVADCTETITVVQRGKYKEIVGHKLRPIGGTHAVAR